MTPQNITQSGQITHLLPITPGLPYLYLVILNDAVNPLLYTNMTLQNYYSRCNIKDVQLFDVKHQTQVSENLFSQKKPPGNLCPYTQE